MKVLLISDNQSDLDKIDKFLKENGYDTIIYHWLLKALDNIEEISPDVTVVSAYDYPRHWKTLVQFQNSGIGRNKSSVILYVPKDFSEDEKKKAEVLGVKGFFDSCDERGLNNLLEMLFVKSDSSSLSFENTMYDKEVEEPVEQPVDEEEDFVVPTVADIMAKDEPIETKIPGAEAFEVPKKKKGSLLARMQELNNA